MAKVTDFNVIQTAVLELAPQFAPSLLDLIGSMNAVWCVMGIYLTNDQTNGYGQDFHVYDGDSVDVDELLVSVISYRNGISVIVDSHASKYQDNVDLCGYQNLTEDITAILMYIQTAIDRIESRL